MVGYFASCFTFIHSRLTELNYRFKAAPSQKCLRLERNNLITWFTLSGIIMGLGKRHKKRRDVFLEDTGVSRLCLVPDNEYQMMCF